jgi:predicted phage baseplate assembly protein
MSGSLDTSLQNLNDCGCCEGISQQTPIIVKNLPGQKAIVDRVGTHTQFKQSLLARLSDANFAQLQELTTRADDDFSIALLDAWATVADVLTFYQERIANESYLRTATERISLLYLARSIGYELRPGVAASTYLTFELEDAPSAPRIATIEIGTKVQSLPNPGEQPQTFETIEKIVTRAEWNVIKPRLTQPQSIAIDSSKFIFEGNSLNLKAGDSLLVMVGDNKKLRRVSQVYIDNAKQQTQIELEGLPSIKFATFASAYVTASFANKPLQINDTTIQKTIVDRTWQSSDLNAYAAIQGWQIEDVVTNINAQRTNVDRSAPTQTGVFALRTRASLFGYNAPKWDSLPASQRKREWIIKRNPNGSFNGWDFVDPAYPNTWEDKTLAADTGTTKQIYLDNTYPSILQKSWLVLKSPSSEEFYQVQESFETSRSEYAISAKVTRLTVDNSTNFDKFKLRETTVLTQSEQLKLADIPILDLVQDNSITLDRAYSSLQIGQKVAITGERSDLKGVITSEIATLNEIALTGGFTKLTFQSSLINKYKRDTVTINANVALTTHGETKTEVLGNGNTSQSYQRFTLRQSPLTYISAANATGAESTLQVRVNDILWHEVPNFYKHQADEHIFITRTDDDGKTTLQFGDGTTGLRLPTGQENITATYRQGIGLSGLVKAKQLSLLMTRPLGVKGVNNPLAATGAQDRESLIEARRNAPLTVLTLDRIVSLQDYQDFARAFAGIAKALATWTWNGQTRSVFLTIAGYQNKIIAKNSFTYTNLLTAIQKASIPHVQVQVEPYLPAPFRIDATVKINPDYQTEKVLADVKLQLLARFSFEHRDLGQPVTKSEIIALIQSTIGVLAVDLNYLYRVGDNQILNDRLIAKFPQPGADGKVTAAELLTLDPNLLNLGVMS